MAPVPQHWHHPVGALSVILVMISLFLNTEEEGGGFESRKFCQCGERFKTAIRRTGEQENIASLFVIYIGGYK